MILCVRHGIGVGHIVGDPEEASESGMEERCTTPWRNSFPQTAIEELEPIIKAALEAKDYAEATKAVALEDLARGHDPGQQAGGAHHAARGGHGRTCPTR